MLGFLPVIFFIITNSALFFLLTIAVKQFAPKAILILFMVILIESIFFAFYTLYSFGGAFGPGVFLFYMSILGTLVITVSAIITGFALIPQLDRQHRAFYIFGAILMISSAISPIVGIEGIGTYCDQQARRYGDHIVAAIRSYKSSTGVYPDKIEMLKENAFKDEARYSCLNGLGIDLEQFTSYFHIRECDEHISLVTSSTDGVRVVWYDLETNEWNRISFLDSGCW